MTTQNERKSVAIICPCSYDRDTSVHAYIALWCKDQGSLSLHKRYVQSVFTLYRSMLLRPVQFFSQPSRRIRVNLLSYESKKTDKREQYD